jgi:hypothetical protein
MDAGRAQDAIKAFKRKLRSDNPKTVQLTLTVRRIRHLGS